MKSTWLDLHHTCWLHSVHLYMRKKLGSDFDIRMHISHTSEDVNEAGSQLLKAGH